MIDASVLSLEERFAVDLMAVRLCFSDDGCLMPGALVLVSGVMTNIPDE